MAQEIASTAAQSIVQGKNMEQAFARLGMSMMQTALSNVMQLETVQGRQRLSDARTAASNAYAAVSGIPVVGPFLAPEAAAA